MPQDLSQAATAVPRGRYSEQQQRSIVTSGETIRMLLVVGAEGTGHHLLRDCLGVFLAQPFVADKADYYPLLEHRWTPMSKLLPRFAERGVFQRIINNLQNRGMTHLFEDTSVPFGPDRSPLKRMDLVDLVDLTRDLFKVSILALYRDPISSTFSNFRRGFSPSLSYECQMTENSHVFIKAQCQAAVGGEYRVLRFENLVECPERQLDVLASWAGISGELLPGGPAPIRPHQRIDKIPVGIRSQLEEYFTPLRRSQWEMFYSERDLTANIHS
jgi:hypothetical protein